jgi:hypothetical protein
MTEFEWPSVTLDVIELSRGRHKSGADGMSPMEAAAWLAGERHSDHPDCTCPVIAAYVRRISDWASDEQRQQLGAFLPRLIGSRSAEHMAHRGEYFARQAVTVFLPLMYNELERPEIALQLHKLPINATMMELHNTACNLRRCYGAGLAAVATDDAIYAIGNAMASFSTSAAAAVGRCALAAYDALSAVAARKHRKSGRQKLWLAALAALDGALAIGPAGPATLTPDMIERLKAYRELSQQSA